MEFDISVKDGYEVVKDGLIVAEEEDQITFKFDDHSFVLLAIILLKCQRRKACFVRESVIGV